MDEKERTEPAEDAADDATAPARAVFAATPPFDPGKYAAYLDDVAATADQKAALLAALWELMTRFVERGFGVDPVQMLRPVLTAARDADDSAGELSSRDDFNQMTTRKGDAR